MWNKIAKPNHSRDGIGFGTIGPLDDDNFYLIITNYLDVVDPSMWPQLKWMNISPKVFVLTTMKIFIKGIYIKHKMFAILVTNDNLNVIKEGEVSEDI